MENYGQMPFVPHFLRGFTGGGAAPSTYRPSLQGGQPAPQGGATPQGGFDFNQLRALLTALMGSPMSGGQKSATRQATPGAGGPLSTQQVRYFPNQAPLRLAPPPAPAPAAQAKRPLTFQERRDRLGIGDRGGNAPGRGGDRDDRGPGHGPGQGGGSSGYGGPR